MTRTRTAATLAAGVLASAALLQGAPAHAETPAAPAAGRTEQSPVVVVMDYSGSMLNDDADSSGTTRVDAAKDAAKDLVDAAPDGARLGFVAFGHRTREDCTDIETVHRLGTVDKGALKDRIDGLAARGETPISGALQQAAEQLQGQESGSIVLVSDGEPSCNTPPACEVAQGLQEQGLDVAIHTIGFRISGDARAQETLECLAEATGGTYTTAEDARQLTETLTTRTTRALQGYTAAGTPVRGGARYEDAVLLLPGQYRDELASHGRQDDLPELNAARFDRGDVKFYRIPLRPGHVPILSATLAKTAEQAASEGGSLIAVQPLGAPGQSRCARYRSHDSSSMDDARGVPTTTWFDRAWTERVLDDASLRERCLTEGGDLVVAVYQRTDLPTDTPTALELSLAYEPLRGPEGSPAPDPQGLSAPDPTPATPLTGGSSFNDAVPLEDGRTITDSLVPGEQRYCTIEAGVNQNVLTRLDFTEDAEQARHVMASLFNPLREAMPLGDGGDRWHGGYALGTVAATAGDTAFNHLRTSIHPNRRLGHHNPGQGDTISVPGRQYVVVSRQYAPDTPATPLPFELTVATAGDSAGTGPEFITTAAQFAERFGEPGGESATPTPADEGAVDRGADDDASGPAAETPSAETGRGQAAGTPAAGAEQVSDDGTPPWAWALGGVGLLAVAAGAGIVLAARRTR